MSGHESAHDHPPVGAEPHHVPHGYIHPIERHHWYWYAGIAGSCVATVLACAVYWQVESSQAPLCARETDDSETSPSGAMEVEVLRVSCLGGPEKQKIVMHKSGGGSQVMVSLDGKAEVRLRWISDNELVLTQTGGKVWTFLPRWGGVHIRYL